MNNKSQQVVTSIPTDPKSLNRLLNNKERHDVSLGDVDVTVCHVARLVDPLPFPTSKLSELNMYKPKAGGGSTAQSQEYVGQLSNGVQMLAKGQYILLKNQRKFNDIADKDNDIAVFRTEDVSLLTDLEGEPAYVFSDPAEIEDHVYVNIATFYHNTPMILEALSYPGQKLDIVVDENTAVTISKASSHNEHLLDDIHQVSKLKVRDSGPYIPSEKEFRSFLKEGFEHGDIQANVLRLPTRGGDVDYIITKVDRHPYDPDYGLDVEEENKMDTKNSSEMKAELSGYQVTSFSYVFMHAPEIRDELSSGTVFVVQSKGALGALIPENLMGEVSSEDDWEETSPNQLQKRQKLGEFSKVDHSSLLKIQTRDSFAGNDHGYDKTPYGFVSWQALLGLEERGDVPEIPEKIKSRVLSKLEKSVSGAKQSAPQEKLDTERTEFSDIQIDEINVDATRGSNLSSTEILLNRLNGVFAVKNSSGQTDFLMVSQSHLDLMRDAGIERSDEVTASAFRNDYKNTRDHLKKGSVTIVTSFDKPSFLMLHSDSTKKLMQALNVANSQLDRAEGFDRDLDSVRYQEGSHKVQLAPKSVSAEEAPIVQPQSVSKGSSSKSTAAVEIGGVLNVNTGGLKERLALLNASKAFNDKIADVKQSLNNEDAFVPVNAFEKIFYITANSEVLENISVISEMFNLECQIVDSNEIEQNKKATLWSNVFKDAAQNDLQLTVVKNSDLGEGVVIISGSQKMKEDILPQIGIELE